LGNTTQKPLWKCRDVLVNFSVPECDEGEDGGENVIWEKSSTSQLSGKGLPGLRKKSRKAVPERRSGVLYTSGQYTSAEVTVAKGMFLLFQYPWKPLRFIKPVL
jgi:hypothetical protein